MTAAASARPVVREQWTDPGRGAHGPCVVVTGDLDAAAQARVDGLVDHLEAAGVRGGAGAARRAGSRTARPRATLTVLVGVDGAPGVDRARAKPPRRGDRRPSSISARATSPNEVDPAGSR